MVVMVVASMPVQVVQRGRQEVRPRARVRGPGRAPQRVVRARRLAHSVDQHRPRRVAVRVHHDLALLAPLAGERHV